MANAMEIDSEGGAFKKLHQLLNEKFLPYHKGETFTADAIWYYFNFHKRKYPTESGYTAAQLREELDKVLYYKTRVKKSPDLEKNGGKYRIIEREFNIVKPNIGRSARFGMKWPYGVDDKSVFSFTETAVVAEGDVMGLGGEGNRGKSVFARALAIENCDDHPVTLVMSENVHMLDENLARVNWKNIFTEDGNWKFEVIEEKKEEKYLDIIRERKDNLVIIDWLNASKDTWLIDQFYKDASERIDKGVVFVIQQKRSYKDYAVGGEAARDYCSVFLLLKKEQLLVDKVKVYDFFDPNDKLYRFNIAGQGSRFTNIAEIYDCPQCKGKRFYQGTQCGRCYGKGYLDVLEPE